MLHVESIVISGKNNTEKNHYGLRGNQGGKGDSNYVSQMLK